MVDPGSHQLWPVLDVQSKQEAAQTSPMGWEQGARSSQGRGGGTIHRHPLPEATWKPTQCTSSDQSRLEGYGRAGSVPEPSRVEKTRIGARDTAAWDKLLGAGTCAPETALPARPQAQPLHPCAGGTANEKPVCPPPRGALAADLFTLPEVERPLSAACALLEPYYNIFASES